MLKCANHDQNSPSARGGPFFGLKTGSRGTPWNRKSAQPGGSDFAKCRFCPFKWHFDHFGGVCIFDTFFDHFWWFTFYHFFCFSVFHFCHFLHFSDFVDFVTFWRFVIFTHFHVFFMFWFIFQFCKGYLKDKALFWPLFLTVVLSHGKHFGGVIS